MPSFWFQWSLYDLFTPHLEKAECEITDGLIKSRRYITVTLSPGKRQRGENKWNDFTGSWCWGILIEKHRRILEAPSAPLENTHHETFQQTGQ